MGFADLHSHVLPGLDDGAPTPEVSLTMLRGLVALGFDTVCATPHQKHGHYLPDLTRIREAHAATRAQLADAGVKLELGLAAENMWDDVFYRRMSGGEIPSYNDGPAFLVEFPLSADLPVGLDAHFFELRTRGKLPVIAHPERYEALWRAPERVERLAQQCAMVVDLGAVAGHHGRKQGKLARKMVKDGTAHAVASDAHTADDVQIAAEGIAWIRKKLGDSAVSRLLDRHPRLILTGEHPDG